MNPYGYPPTQHYPPPEHFGYHVAGPGYVQAPPYVVGAYPHPYYVGDVAAPAPESSGLQTPWRDVLIGGLAGAVFILLFKRWL